MNISVEEEQEKHHSLTCYINLYVTEIFLYKKSPMVMVSQIKEVSLMNFQSFKSQKLYILAHMLIYQCAHLTHTENAV